MNTRLLSFAHITICVILVPFASLSSMAQNVTFFPQVDSVNIVGSCTPPQMVCQLSEDSSGVDTIVIRSPYDALCTAYPPTEVNRIPECYFIIHDSLNQFHYELWLRYDVPYYCTQKQLGFDTTYFFNPGPFRIFLYVLSGDCIVDSASVKFHSITTGLFVDDAGHSKPSCFALEQNFPNPFNGQTNIRFSTARSGKISLYICNILGQQINILFDGFLNKGIHFMVWRTSGLSSGLYFIVLNTSNEHKAIKCNLLQ